jgi:hypothetical protein
MTTTKTSTKPPKAPKTRTTGEPPQPLQAIQQALPMAPETLARTLRAVAAELERDPALARRVAAAVQDQGNSVPPSSPTASGGVPRERGLAGGEASAKNGKNGKPTKAIASHEDDAPPATSAKTAKPRPFVPRLITGASPELGTGVPDPFALSRRLGADGLRAALDELRLGTLRAIVREYTLDPAGRLAGQNDAERLRTAILDAARGA